MQIDCPNCGPRDAREFYCKGTAVSAGDMHAHLHLRDNAPGVIRELWHHEGGCRAWLVVERNTQTHEMIRVERAEDAQ